MGFDMLWNVNMFRYSTVQPDKRAGTTRSSQLAGRWRTPRDHPIGPPSHLMIRPPSPRGAKLGTQDKDAFRARPPPAAPSSFPHPMFNPEAVYEVKYVPLSA